MTTGNARHLIREKVGAGFKPAPTGARRYCACALSACMSASLRKLMTVTLRVR
jgi:hypothetical protein